MIKNNNYKYIIGDSPKAHKPQTKEEFGFFLAG